jgi:CDP-diacylglycerol--glycerol-3-phosphate 3-phosphatidyltransferase
LTDYSLPPQSGNVLNGDLVMKIQELLTGRVVTFSNFLSLFRIMLVPFFWYYLFKEHHSGNITFMYRALIILIIIALTDFLDGYLARIFNQVSRLGQFLDPISDKITVFFCGILLYFFKDFPLWVVVVVFVRDLIILSGGYFLFIKKDIQVRPNIFGKGLIISLFISGVLYICSPSQQFFDISLQHISCFFCSRHPWWRSDPIQKFIIHQLHPHLV